MLQPPPSPGVFRARGRGGHGGGQWGAAGGRKAAGSRGDLPGAAREAGGGCCLQDGIGVGNIRIRDYSTIRVWGWQD